MNGPADDKSGLLADKKSEKESTQTDGPSEPDESNEKAETIMESGLEEGKDGGEDSSETSVTERVIIYSRGEEQQWTQFDEQQKLASEKEEKDEEGDHNLSTTTEAASSEAINQDGGTFEEGESSASLIATEKNANEQSEEAVESGNVINEGNEASGVGDANAIDTTTGGERTEVKDEKTVEEKGEENAARLIGDDKGKSPNSDDLKETKKGEEGVLVWSKPADDVIEQAAATGDKSEEALSQQFKSGQPKEGTLASGNLQTSEDPGEMMQVVYGRDAPEEDDSERAKRSWTAKDADNRNLSSSQSADPQLDWEGRKSSGNIRYVMNEPQSQSADSAIAPKKGSAKSKVAAKRPENEAGSSYFICL